MDDLDRAIKELNEAIELTQQRIDYVMTKWRGDALDETRVNCVMADKSFWFMPRQQFMRWWLEWCNMLNGPALPEDEE